VKSGRLRLLAVTSRPAQLLAQSVADRNRFAPIVKERRITKDA
jgi:hypothetical protein